MPVNKGMGHGGWVGIWHDAARRRTPQPALLGLKGLYQYGRDDGGRNGVWHRCPLLCRGAACHAALLKSRRPLPAPRRVAFHPVKPTLLASSSVDGTVYVYTVDGETVRTVGPRPVTVLLLYGWIAVADNRAVPLAPYTQSAQSSVQPAYPARPSYLLVTLRLPALPARTHFASPAPMKLCLECLPAPRYTSAFSYHQ